MKTQQIINVVSRKPVVGKIRFALRWAATSPPDTITDSDVARLSGGKGTRAAIAALKAEELSALRAGLGRTYVYVREPFDLCVPGLWQRVRLAEKGR